MSKKRFETGTGPGQRVLRVGELVRHAVAEILMRGEIVDDVLNSHIITVPEVRMTPDLKLATAYVLPLGGKDSAQVLAALERNRKLFRSEIARRVTLRYAPDIRFRIDESFDEAAHIDGLLRSSRVKLDTDSAHQTDADRTDDWDHTTEDDDSEHER